MPLENRNVEPGTVLVARYKKQDRTCDVVQTDDGLRYRLDDGTEHRSPSSAGKAAMGGVACNGWRFWSLKGDPKPAKEPKKAKAERPAKTPAKKKSAVKKTKKGRNAKSASAASYGCGACSEEFPTMKAATKHALTHTAA